MQSGCPPPLKKAFADNRITHQQSFQHVIALATGEPPWHPTLTLRLPVPGIEVWNPAFDVTPASLITGGIITEKGVLPAGDVRRLADL